MAVLEPHLADIWLFIIGFFLLYYAVADGSDLGVGMLSLFTRDESDRAMLMGSLESVWHANQTWLVLLGGMLFGAFPLFYSLVLSSLYIPILIMLFGLVFRGVAFEFREHAAQKRFWEVSFGLGSLTTALAQGFALGGLLGGLEVKNGQFAGSVWDWLTPSSALVAAGVLSGYLMLGANYLILKTRDEVQQKSFRYSVTASLSTLVISVLVHLNIILKYPHVTQKWLALSEFYHVAIFPFLALAAFILYFQSLRKRREAAPFFWNAVIILLSFVGLSVGMYPYMIPNIIASPVTVKTVAASPRTLLFMLVATAVLLPVILVYTVYNSRVFRGKASGSGYSYDQ